MAKGGGIYISPLLHQELYNTQDHNFCAGQKFLKLKLKQLAQSFMDCIHFLMKSIGVFALTLMRAKLHNRAS